jgi:D-beta-D-heptose 7-phosphate kinase/D-beta-D-heptose 1-phosphate adenosyltransferase
MQHLRTVIDQLLGSRVLVIGDVMLDEYLKGNVSRISPEAPVPILEVKSHEYTLGGAANAAANICALGGASTVIGLKGTDENARILTQRLRDHGIGDEVEADPARPTSTKTRFVAQAQQIMRVDRENTTRADGDVADKLRARIDKAVASTQAVVLSDYNKGVITPEIAQHAIRAARRAGVPVVVDPKKASFTCYAGATVITPNLHELEIAAPRHDTFEMDHAATSLLAHVDGSAILVTRSADGMTLFRSGEQPFHVPALAKEVYDVTGAGDTVVATVALALAAGARLEPAIELASVAAAVSVSKRGTSTVTASELQAALEHGRS